MEFVDKLHELVRKAESDLKKLQVSVLPLHGWVWLMDTG